MPKIQFDVNIANGVVIDVANVVLPVWWMEVYPFCLNQSKSLLHAEIKWLLYAILGLDSCTSVHRQICSYSHLPAASLPGFPLATDVKTASKGAVQRVDGKKHQEWLSK